MDPWKVDVITPSVTLVDQFHLWDETKAKEKRMRSFNRAKQWISRLLNRPFSVQPAHRMRQEDLQNAVDHMVSAHANGISHLDYLRSCLGPPEDSMDDSSEDSSKDSPRDSHEDSSKESPGDSHEDSPKAIVKTTPEMSSASKVSEQIESKPLEMKFSSKVKTTVSEPKPRASICKAACNGKVC